MRRAFDSVPRVISLFFLVLLISACVDQCTKVIARDRLANMSTNKEASGIVIAVSERQNGMTVEQLLEDAFPLMSEERARDTATHYVKSTAGQALGPTDEVEQGDHVRVMYRHIVLIEDALVLELHRNTRASFNLGMTGAGLSVRGMGLIGLMLVAASLLALGFMPRRSVMASVGLGLFAGGSLGNAMDRLMHGHVTDFILTPHLPPFNIADITIAAASLCIIIDATRLLAARRLDPFHQKAE